MSRPLLPLVRQEDLVVQAAADELLVFDRRTDKAYVLNPTAAAVWRAANGQRTVQDIATYLSQETPTSEQMVSYALGQMQELLQEPAQVPRDLKGISRRQFLKRAGLIGAAAAVPVVVCIAVPSPVHAQSGCELSGACVIACNQCCSESCTFDPTCPSINSLRCA